MNKLPARADFDLHPTEHLARERMRKILRGLFLSMVPGEMGSQATFLDWLLLLH
jgi:hypothetical protein